jgi:CubicO group peptidase (beta-lactamase class C family)
LREPGKHSAYGHAQTHNGEERLETLRPMCPDSVFDLASITKVAATTAAIMPWLTRET